MPDLRRAPGPPFLQILRYLPRLMDAPHEVFLELRERYGDLVRLPGVPGSPVFLVSHPHSVKRVLVDHYRKYRKSSHLRRIREQGFGNGLVNSEGELWQRQRRTLQPYFHGSSIERFADGIDAEAALTERRWQEAAARAQPIDLEDEMLDLLTRITSRFLVGEPLGDVVGSARRAFLRAARIAPILGDVPGPGHSDLTRKISLLRSKVADLIRAPKIQSLESMLLPLTRARDPLTGRAMSEDQLIDEIVTFLYTGLETSAMGLTWLWHLLTGHRATEEEIRRGAAHRPGDALGHPALLEATISEVLRLYPPSWAIGRVAVEPDEIDGCKIPVGSKLILSQYVVHRHPGFWPDPEEFRPERFLSPSIDQGLACSYFPFGSGPRACIGRDLSLMEIRRVAAYLIPRFRLHPVSQEPVGIEPTVTLKPRARIRMIVEAIRQEAGANSVATGEPRQGTPRL